MAVVPRTDHSISQDTPSAFFLMFFFKTRSKVCPGWPKIYPVTPVRRETFIQLMERLELQVLHHQMIKLDRVHSEAVLGVGWDWEKEQQKGNLQNDRNVLASAWRGTPVTQTCKAEVGEGRLRQIQGQPTLPREVQTSVSWLRLGTQLASNVGPSFQSPAHSSLRKGLCAVPAGYGRREVPRLHHNCLCLPCVALTAFCSFLSYHLFLLPESKLYENKGPSVIRPHSLYISA